VGLHNVKKLSEFRVSALQNLGFGGAMETSAAPPSSRATAAAAAAAAAPSANQSAAKRKKAGGREESQGSVPGAGTQQHFAIGPAEDDAVIRQRLLTRTTTTRGEPPLKKLLKRFFAFSAEVEKESSSNISECEKLYRAFLQELSSFELPLLKTKVVIGANRREQDSFKELQCELDRKIIQVYKFLL
jgi:THO complex subunit 7